MRQGIRAAVCFGLLVALATFACAPAASSTIVVAASMPKARDAGASDVPALVGAINDFAFDAVRASNEPTPDGNVVVAPLSVHECLSLAANGAEGETAEQIRRALRIGSLESDTVNASWAALLRDMEDRSRKQTLETAASMWLAESLTFNEPFVATDRGSFGAEMRTVDFADPASAEDMNAWLSQNTLGRITSLATAPDANTALELLTTMYFDGKWETPFPKKDTYDGTFLLPDRNRVPAELMRSEGEYGHAEIGDFYAARLPYKGGDSSLYLLVPTGKIPLYEAEKSLDARTFATLRDELAKADKQAHEYGSEFTIVLPKMSSRTKSSLVPALKKLGVTRAFEATQAQFGPMLEATDGPPLWIDRLDQQSVFDIDENGMKVAVSVEMGMSGAAAAISQLVCDRPFVMALVDEPTGVILFLAEINDPRK